MTADIKPSSGTTQVVDPTVRFITQLLEDLQSGSLFIPRFQRGDVWNDEDRLELLDSIETRIPIGSIMLWRTQRAMTTRRQIGGHVLPVPPEQPPNTPRDYVLDGLQRLSTLLRALVPADQTPPSYELLDEDDAPNRPIYYDLRQKAFRVRGREPIEPWHLPTDVLLYTLPLLAFQRKLEQSEADDAEELIRRADRLANSFRTYKIPVVWLVTNRLEDATQAFHRINSMGERMGEAHMLNALTYRDGFDLEQKLQDLQPVLASVEWQSLDQKFILATVRALCELDVTQPNAEALKDRIRNSPDLVTKAVEALVRAAKLLRKECNVPTPFWVPYLYQSVFLAYALRNQSADDLPAPLSAELGRWFWRTGYTDYLRIGSRYQTQLRTMHALDDLVSGRTSSWRETDGLRVDALPTLLNFRTARTKLFGLRLAMLQPRSLLSGEPFADVCALLAEYAGTAFEYVVPRQNANGRWNSPENRLLYAPTNWRADQSVLNPILLDILGTPQDEAALRSHALDAECLRLLSENRPTEFLDHRRSLLVQLESEFLQELGLEPLPDSPGSSRRFGRRNVSTGL